MKSVRVLSIVLLVALASCFPKKSDAARDAGEADEAGTAAVVAPIDAGVHVDAPKPTAVHAAAKPAKTGVLGSSSAPTPSAKPSAAAAASAAGGPPKCGANQHYDDINKKCRAFGDCPAGYQWNDPMKSCIQQ